MEYKLRLKQPLPGLRFQQLVTQLNYRLSEGAGECFYCVGTEFDLESFSAYTASLKGTCASAGERLVCRHSQSACNGLLAFCMPSRKCSGLLAPFPEWAACVHCLVCILVHCSHLLLICYVPLLSCMHASINM